MHICNLKLLEYSRGTWQKQLMASPHNLIDFSGEENNEIQPPKTATPTTDTASTNPVVVTSGLQNDKVNEATQAINAAKAAGKSNKSLFEITRVETRENAGGDADDSELDMDDTISEHNESSSTSVLDLITKQSQTESKEPSKEQERISTQLPDTSSPNTSSITNNINNDGPTPLVSNTALSQQETQVSQSQNLQQQQPTAQNNQAQNIHQPSQQNQSIEPPSRFRIVKIAKQKPYEKGNWMVNDFKDPQKQTESTSTEAPSSPAVKKRNPTSDSGTITSPTEPVKTKSSEFLTKALLVSHSRGSSYNTGDRRLSTERYNIIYSYECLHYSVLTS